MTPERWIVLWKRLGARSGPESIFESVAERYSEPHRAYHTLAHVARCLWELDRSRELAERAEEVELALWLHDVIYDPHAADNEERSAAFAGKLMHEGGLPEDLRGRVAALIRATDHHEEPAPKGDAALVVDIDLSVLGAPPAEFDLYERQVRQEYRHLADDAFRRGRRAFLERFLARPSLYRTETFRLRYEDAARANVARSVERLKLA